MPDSKKFSLELIDPQIVKMEVNGNVELAQQDARQIIDEAIQLVKGENYAVLFNVKEWGVVSFEAREEFAKNKKRIGAAMISDSLANRLLGNFFINFHKPSTPSRIFADETSAVDWLREQVKKSELDSKKAKQEFL